jgi:glycosyltransferase involved in cell wall biosynthesis
MKRGLRVFQVLAGGPWGGGGVVVLSLAKRLMQEGCQVMTLCLSDEVSRRFSEAGAEVVTSRFWRRNINPLFDLLAFYELFRICKNRRFDIVHTHTSKGGFLGRIAARVARVPTIIHTIHGFAFHEFTGGLVTALYVHLEKLAARFCDFIICVNNEDRCTAIDKGIAQPDKIVTILNGIDLRQFEGIVDTDLQREGLGLPKEAMLVGTVGRLAPQKGFVHLIEAIPYILRAHPQTWFLFAGDGPLKAELQALAKDLGVADRCRFLGFRRDIPQLLMCYDIFALPSLWEGLSVTLLEAMATGRAVIATDIKGNREVVTDGVNGVLCQPRNSQALANAIIHLLENQEKARLLGMRARQTIEQRFDEQIMLERTLELYRTLTGRAGLPLDQHSLGGHLLETRT